MTVLSVLGRPQHRQEHGYAWCAHPCAVRAAPLQLCHSHLQALYSVRQRNERVPLPHSVAAAACEGLPQHRTPLSAFRAPL